MSVKLTWRKGWLHDYVHICSCLKPANLRRPITTSESQALISEVLGSFPRPCLPLATTCTLECSCSPSSSLGCSHLFPIPPPQPPDQASFLQPAWNSTIPSSSDAGMQFFFSSLHSEFQFFSNP